MRIHRPIWILAITLVTCGGCSEPLSSGSAAGFDVALITLDTTRPDRLGSYGYEKADTPNLDRLAREGIRFRDAVSPTPLTLVAHTSILTGLDPYHHGVRHNGQYRLDPSQVTVAEVLHGNGYETAAFVSAFVLDARYGLAQGFDHYDDRTEPLPGQPFSGMGERSAKAVTDAALDWLSARRSKKPYFLWVHYYDPHIEYRPPPEFAKRFASNPYDGEIAYMDSEIGRLLAKLQEKKERLLLIAAGDHGEAFGEHSEYTHSRLLYETTQHVPLLLWSPAIVSKPRVADGVVGLVDIFPTVLDLLGIEIGTPVDGVSLRLAESQGNRTIYMETLAPYLDNGWAPLHGMRRRHEKYVFAPRAEYYDLAADPEERNNLLVARGEAASELANELAERLKDTPSAAAIAAAAAKPDPESLRRLQALGYLSGPGPTSAVGDDLPDPKDMMPVQAMVLESRGLRRVGRLDDALAKAREAVDRAPRDLEALEEVALVYIELNRLEEAETALRAFTKLKPNPNGYVLLAQILAATGRSPEGEALLTQALTLEPDHGGVMITTGDLLARRGNYDQALFWYQKAKSVDPYRATAVADRRIVELRKRASGS